MVVSRCWAFLFNCFTISVEDTVSSLQVEMSKQTESMSGLSKQIKLVRHLPSEVGTLLDNVNGFVLQLPTGSFVRSLVVDYLLQTDSLKAFNSFAS